jgi:speckle-type POZ protein
VRLIKIKGFSARLDSNDCIKSPCCVDGYDWEIRVYPAKNMFTTSEFGCLWVAVELILLNKPRVCKAVLVCRVVDPSGNLEPKEQDSVLLYNPVGQNSVWLVRRKELAARYLKNDTLTLQCAITVLKELPEPTITAEEMAATSYTLNQHLGELLQSGTGADVTFLVSGESFPAHKNILAARSPVFMAEFFGETKEKSSQAVAIDDMEVGVFKALLRFIYTDTVPEFEKQEEALMAEHLFAAADRYGLDRLKLICVGKLSSGISVHTAAMMLALAEQHSCSLLKAKCVEFILGGPEILNSVLETDGYKHLEASCPLVVIDLLKTARCRKI